MSDTPKRDSRINALLVTVWFAVRAADVTSTASSNVIVISNVPVSATSPSLYPTEIGVPEPKTSAKLRIQIKTSGCASALSLPELPWPGESAQPPDVAMASCLEPPESCPFESIGRNLGRLSAVVLFPHKPIVFLLLFLQEYSFFLYLCYLKPRRFNSFMVLGTLV